MSQGIFAKYFDKQNLDLYGGMVVGRSLQGFPIVGNTVPYLKQDEMESMPLYNNFRSDWFRMWLPADKARFDEVMDHVYNGEFFIKHRHDVPVPDYPADEPGGSLKVWLEWCEVRAKPTNWNDNDALPAVPEFSANIPIASPAGG